MRIRSGPGRAGAVLCALAAVLLALAGCGGNGGGSGSGKPVAIGSIHRSGTAGLKVVSARGETLAVAPVEIDGKGPFPFIVDTGASRSVVDQQVARRLGLHPGRASQQVNGVGCTSKAAEATVSSWRVGGVTLPKATVNVLDMAVGQGGGVAGLLGSDVLSEFGIVALDYEHQQLRLGSGAVDLSKRSADTVPVKVLHAQDAVLVVAPVHVQGGGPYAFVVDTGAATSVIDSGLAGKLHLAVTGHGQAAGVACQTTTGTVQISQWKVAGVALPGTTLTSVDLPDSRKGQGLQGLLGSDTLSTFGTVAVDYVHQKLLLAARATAATG